MFSFRVIVVVDGERTIQVVTTFERVPSAGATIALPGRAPVTVRHVIEAPRHGLAGVVLAWVDVERNTDTPKSADDCQPAQIHERTTCA